MKFDFTRILNLPISLNVSSAYKINTRDNIDMPSDPYQMYCGIRKRGSYVQHQSPI